MTIDRPAWDNSAEQFIDNLFSWLSHEGQSRYDEAVTQLEHALQGAALVVKYIDHSISNFRSTPAK